MVRRRLGLTLTLVLLGLVSSVLLTLVFWPHFLFFLPLIFFFPWMGHRQGAHRSARTCPTCGWSADDESHEFCPRDGAKLHG